MTWTSIDDPDLLVNVVTFALDPAHPGVLFAGGHWALARSRNAGAAWMTEDMECMDVESIDVVAKTGEVYAAGIAGCQFQGGGVRRSLDGGITWTDVSESASRSPRPDLRRGPADAGSSLFAGDAGGRRRS